ncbi:hypothetical protein SRHO_G00333110 [Serrasalmus rhombeus]
MGSAERVEAVFTFSSDAYQLSHLSTMMPRTHIQVAISPTSNREISLMGVYTQEDELEHSSPNEDCGEGDWGVVTFRALRTRRTHSPITSIQSCF